MRVPASLECGRASEPPCSGAPGTRLCSPAAAHHVRVPMQPLLWGLASQSSRWLCSVSWVGVGEAEQGGVKRRMWPGTEAAGTAGRHQERRE